MYCRCGSTIPQARIDLGYSKCVDCSTEDRWSCNPLTFHKTGNSIEIIKDPELAEDVARKAARRNYGVLKGVTGSYKKTKSVQPREIKIETPKEYVVVKSRRKPDPSRYEFETVGQEAMAMADNGDSLEIIESYLADQVQKIRIHPTHKAQILSILEKIDL